MPNWTVVVCYVGCAEAMPHCSACDRFDSCQTCTNDMVVNSAGNGCHGGDQ